MGYPPAAISRRLQQAARWHPEAIADRSPCTPFAWRRPDGVHRVTYGKLLPKIIDNEELRHAALVMAFSQQRPTPRLAFILAPTARCDETWSGTAPSSASPAFKGASGECARMRRPCF